MGMAVNNWNKFVALRHEFLRLYQSRVNTYEIAKQFGASVETVRRGIHAVGGRTSRRARKYFVDGKRERHLMSTYDITISEMEKLKQLQKQMCLWCRAPLPENVLDCVVDHAGGIETRKDKTKVRGLCCKNGHCNRLAGMVETGEVSANSLFRPFVLRVRRIVKMYFVKGPLS